MGLYAALAPNLLVAPLECGNNKGVSLKCHKTVPPCVAPFQFGGEPVKPFQVCVEKNEVVPFQKRVFGSFQLSRSSVPAN